MSDFHRWFVAAAALSLSAGAGHAQAPYLISTYAGGLATPTAAPGPSYAFRSPTGVAADRLGNTYISTLYDCVFRLDQSGNLSRVAGTCQPGFSGDGGSAVNAQLNNPQGIALDSLGNLYIADQGNQRIRQVTPAGTISTVAGTGTAGYSGDNDPATGAQLNQPQAVAADAAGNVYVADAGNSRIRRFTPGGTIATFAGTGVSGSSGDGGPAAAATFMSPSGLAFDASGNLYISDGAANRVRMVNLAGHVMPVAGTGTAGSAGDTQPAVSAELSNPQGLALDGAGNLYIADDGNRRVRQVDVQGNINTFAGSGSFIGPPGDGGPATSAVLLGPVGVAADSNGNLYIADLIGAVRVVNANMIQTVAGSNTTPLPFSGDGGPADLAQFAAPFGLARDTSGNLYVADLTNFRLRKIDANGTISTVAGNGTQSDSGDGGLASNATVTPRALAVDSQGDVYIGGSSVVREIANGNISRVAGGGSSGLGDNGPATSAVLGSYLPGLAVDSHGNIYIADYFNQRVRMVTVATGIITTIAGNGTAGYSGDGAPAVSAELKYPAGLALDAGGNLYIADSQNCRVRMVSAVNGVISAASTISTVAGNGTCGSTGDSGQATSAEITKPMAVAVDGNGNLYIATAGNTIRKVSGGMITTVAGNGIAGYAGDGGLATSAQLDSPMGLAVDPGGNIYVSDSNNAAVRVLQPETEPMLTVSSTHSGTFAAGGSGTFTITVTDAAQAAPASGTVTVTARLPASFTPVAMGGTGWNNCSIASLPYSCQTSGSNSNPIDLTVNVPAGGPTQVTNQVTVSGGGALGTAFEDLAFIGSGTPVLEVSASHQGDFVAGTQGVFTITVANQISAADTSGSVTIQDTLPAGLTLVSMSGGTDWNCTGTTCTSGNTPLAGGAAYAPITGTVKVASNASSPLINKVTASGGGSASPPPSFDSITVVYVTGCEIAGNASVTVADVQAIVNQSLGIVRAANDPNSDGVTNVVDIQIVINAALNLGCTL